MFITYPAIFYKNLDEEGYTVIFPDLDGCLTCGIDEKDSFYMATDVLGTYLYEYFTENKEFPKSSSVLDVKIEPIEFTQEKESFISLVGLDIAEYVKKVDKKSVKKTLTIPSYLNEMGKSMNINFSQLLTDALKTEFDIE